MATAKRYVSLAKAGNAVRCMFPDGSLSPEQQNTLHAFKHETLAGLHRVYMSVPQKKADPIVKKALADMIKAWDRAQLL